MPCVLHQLCKVPKVRWNEWPHRTPQFAPSLGKPQYNTEIAGCCRCKEFLPQQRCGSEKGGVSTLLWRWQYFPQLSGRGKADNAIWRVFFFITSSPTLLQSATCLYVDPAHEAPTPEDILARGLKDICCRIVGKSPFHWEVGQTHVQKELQQSYSF